MKIRTENKDETKQTQANRTINPRKKPRKSSNSSKQARNTS